ncbi:hypothetical protein LJC24_02470 [Desulfococcaceae bacterium OttesenSCG-928-F15]|nr:hypothetical protein [Desulfococcaceae bacterium OttesenSCG-928-F15]
MKKKSAKGDKASEKNGESTQVSAEEILFRRIAEKSKEDPLFGAQIGSRELTHRMISAMKTGKGVHTESLFCALGALAGYACQAALREQALARGFFSAAYFTPVTTDDGKTFYFGDHLTRFLAESQYSVWNITSGGAKEAGCSDLPDMAEILKHNAAVLGAADFGKPRVPDKNQPLELPSVYTNLFWPHVKPLIIKFCPDPEFWPMMVSFAAKEALLRGKSVVDPCIGLRIIMESAVAASRIKREDTGPKNTIS